MHGVNFSGFEYSCLDGAMNDGPTPPNVAEVNGMKSWNINSVRIPLMKTVGSASTGLPRPSPAPITKTPSLAS